MIQGTQFIYCLGVLSLVSLDPIPVPATPSTVPRSPPPAPQPFLLQKTQATLRLYQRQWTFWHTEYPSWSSATFLLRISSPTFPAHSLTDREPQPPGPADNRHNLGVTAASCSIIPSFSPVLDFPKQSFYTVSLTSLISPRLLRNILPPEKSKGICDRVSTSLIRPRLTLVLLPAKGPTVSNEASFHPLTCAPPQPLLSSLRGSWASPSLHYLFLLHLLTFVSKKKALHLRSLSFHAVTSQRGQYPRIAPHRNLRDPSPDLPHPSEMLPGPPVIKSDGFSWPAACLTLLRHLRLRAIKTELTTPLPVHSHLLTASPVLPVRPKAPSCHCPNGVIKSPSSHHGHVCVTWFLPLRCHDSILSRLHRFPDMWHQAPGHLPCCWNTFTDPLLSKK